MSKPKKIHPSAAQSVAFKEGPPGVFMPSTEAADAPTKIVAPTKLEEVDRLKAENLSLKLANIGTQFDRLAQERTRLSREFDKLIQECKDKYGVDITTTRIDAEGNFLGPLAPTGPSRATKAL